MKRNWFVQPESVRVMLPETDGEWIELKKQLTVGEEDAMKASLMSEIRADGRITPNFEMVEKAQVLAYLISWSITDAKGQPIPINTDAQKLDAINGMDRDGFALLKAAVTAHVDKQDALRDEKKRAQSGETDSSLTSASVA